MCVCEDMMEGTFSREYDVLGVAMDYGYYNFALSVIN